MNPNSPETVPHPTTDTLVAYFYQEMTPEERAATDAHIRSCPDCQSTLRKWDGVSKALAQWEVIPSTPPPRRTVPLLHWGLAASIVLGLGIGLGRLSAPRVPTAQELSTRMLPLLQAELKQQVDRRVQDQTAVLRSELRDEIQQTASSSLATNRFETRELVSALAQNWASARAADQNEVQTLFTRAEQNRKNDVVRLRRDLETVALFTDQGLQQAQQNIQWVALNNPSQALGSPSSIRPVTNPPHDRNTQ